MNDASNNAAQTAGSFADKIFTKGSKVLEGSGRLGQVGLDAFKQVVDSQLELGSAFAELGASQFKSLSQLGAPSELLQRQKEAAELFGGKLQSYFEQLRSIAQDTKESYVTVGKEVAADLTGKTTA